MNANELPMQEERTYIAIDLKSFYASVECVRRKMDPLTTNLVVADVSRTEKTICLAVSPSLKAYGIGGRARLFEVVERVKEVNKERRSNAPGHSFTGKSVSDPELKAHPELELDFVAAAPHMADYIECSSKIYKIYLKYIAPEDIHVYSVDEVFIDATNYLRLYRLTAHELAMKMIKDVLAATGITATAGIGTNLYLCKVAMDIVAKKMPADKDGVRIAELDEMTYRRQLWDYQPITKFWRVGSGIAQKLERIGIYTMGQVAKCSVRDEEILYKLFGVNAELLIDHAWGWEPCTIEAIKAYKPRAKSLSNGQVLKSPYLFSQARTVILEMADSLALELVEKRLTTDQIVINVGYDTENLKGEKARGEYKGEVVYDRYGRPVPKPSHGSMNLGKMTSSSRAILKAVDELFHTCADPSLFVRRLNVCANHIADEDLEQQAKAKPAAVQLDMFTDYQQLHEQQETEARQDKKERKMQEALLSIKKKFGKNAILKGLDFNEGATTRERNNQIGGHNA